MRDRKHLQLRSDFAVDEREWKLTQGNCAQVRRAHYFEPARIAGSSFNGPQERQVLSRAKTGPALLVEGDLLLVLQRGIWMEAVIHLSRA